MKERECKIIGKKEVETIYKEKESKIMYFVIEDMEEESIVKLIEKMLVNIILTVVMVDYVNKLWYNEDAKIKKK